MIDLMTKLSFSLHQNKGVYAVLLGSGISYSADIPTGWEVTCDLVSRVAERQGVKPQADWAAWYRETSGKEPDYSDLLDRLTSTPEERRSILHGYIEPTEEEREQGKKMPTLAHRAIARLVRGGFIRVILTTNFDRLMEQALSAEGIEPTVISSDDSLHGAIPLIHSRCTVVKLHGDYLDTRIKNTDAELSEYSADMNQYLDRILDDHGLIVCGWSADWDIALRDALKRVPNRRYGMFWAHVGPLTTHASDVVRHRQADEIPIQEADSFFDTLENQVQALENHKKNVPQNITLLLATAKRYIPRPEYRIQLTDLVGETQRQLQAAIEKEGLFAPVDLKNEEIEGRVSLYEEICEPLVRLLGVLGRYGDGTEEEYVIDVLRDLNIIPVPRGELPPFWYEQCRYPAFLAWYGYGLGLTASQRFKALFHWLTVSVQEELRRESEPAVLSFSLRSNVDPRRDYWRNLKGHESSYTPLSDHLWERFSQWMPDYMSSSVRQGEVFDLFELLMFFATLESEQEKEEELYRDYRSRRITPYGRFMNPYERRHKIVQYVSGQSVRGKILSAGFFGGKEDGFNKEIANILK